MIARTDRCAVHVAIDVAMATVLQFEVVSTRRASTITGPAVLSA